MSSYGISRVLNSAVPFQRLRISPVCGKSSIVISLCCPKNLTVVLQRSVRSAQNGCSSCIGSNRVRLALPCTPHPSSLPVIPVVSRFIAWVFLLSIHSMQGFSVGAISLWCSVVRAVTCGTVDCTFVRTDAWLDFSRDLVSL